MHFHVGTFQHFDVDIYKFQRGQTKCRHCSQSTSIGERLIEEVLYFFCKEFNYSYFYQKIFDDLNSSKGASLRFDFQLLYKDGTFDLFEFQGQQHFYFIKYFHKSYEDFLEHQNNDLLKKKYCLDNFYPLLTLNYECLLETHEILMNYLNFNSALKQKFNQNLVNIRNELWKRNLITVFTIHGRYVDSFITISEAQIELCNKNIIISQSCISNCLSNKRNQAKGLFFIKHNNISSLQSKIEHLKKQKPSLFYMVKLTPIKNKKDHIQMSVAQAITFLRLNRSSQVTQCCHFNSNSHLVNKHSVHGYIFEWIDCPPYEPFVHS